MSKRKVPPPDHLVPISWLEKVGVTAEELDKWAKAELVIKVTIHGGAQFVSFARHNRPVKFNEVTVLVADARQLLESKK